MVIHPLTTSFALPPSSPFWSLITRGTAYEFSEVYISVSKKQIKKGVKVNQKKKIKLENIISYLKPYYFCSYINERASLNTWLIFRIESDLPPTITIQYQKKSFWMEKNKRNMELILILCYTFLFHQIHDKWLFLYAL